MFDEVLMVGTPDYTKLGRPNVEGVRVFATLEEISQSEKVIVFKKKRRKGYMKSRGQKQTLNVVKIDKIEHIMQDEELQDDKVATLNRGSLQQVVKMF